MDKRKIVEAIKMALEQTGKMAFQASQEAVPTVTGGLKQSGMMQSTSSEFVIRYTKEYACIYPSKPTLDGKGWPYVIGSEGEKRILRGLEPGILLKNGFGTDNEVIAIDKKKVYKPKLFKITTESGKVIILTDNHRLPTEEKGLIQVKDLEVGDNVYTEEPTKKQIAWNKNLTKETDKRLMKCSAENKGKKRSENTKSKMKENHWSKKREHSFNYSGDVAFKCFWCGKFFIITTSASEKRYSKGNHFCSKGCEKDWRKIKYSGKGNPHYGKQYPIKYSGGGYRSDIDHYVRSTWEANFARLLKCSDIKYAYEPKRFYAENCSYCPDFWLIDEDIYIELGVTCVKKMNGSFERMNKVLEVNPELADKLFFIDEARYAELEEKCSEMIEEWE